MVNRRKISFEVQESWRGASFTHFTVRNSQSDGNCGYNFIQGQEYLVYVDQWADEPLHASTCSRTTALASATEELNYLQTLPKLELTGCNPKV